MDSLTSFEDDCFEDNKTLTTSNFLLSTKL